MVPKIFFVKVEIKGNKDFRETKLRRPGTDGSEGSIWENSKDIEVQDIGMGHGPRYQEVAEKYFGLGPEVVTQPSG